MMPIEDVLIKMNAINVINSECMSLYFLQEQMTDVWFF